MLKYLTSGKGCINLLKINLPVHENIVCNSYEIVAKIFNSKLECLNIENECSKNGSGLNSNQFGKTLSRKENADDGRLSLR